MSQKHDVIALISGGKDSFLSLLHCLAQNHRIIALANLYPSAQDPASDLNSYMYQTVGHTIVPLYAKVLNVPLYRGEIFGSSGSGHRDYHPQALKRQSASSVNTFPMIDSAERSEEILDETESLLPLLRHIIAIHPTASALSSGAILSTYQRTRVESVALRLNLIPLAYLWQYPVLPCPIPSQTGLLDQLAAVGLEARIVKVASGGLDEGLLWADLRDERSRKKVEKGVSRFGGSVLGEGGEYETLVLDGPRELFEGRIEVEDGERWIGRGEGGEAWLGFSRANVVDKKVNIGKGRIENLNVPELWDEGFGELAESLKGKVAALQGPANKSFYRKAKQDDWDAKLVITKSASTITFSNILAPSSLSNSVSQTSNMITSIKSLLATHSLSPSAIIFTSLFLRSMSEFTPINDIYATLFSKPNPPARVTVGCGDILPDGVDVMANLVVNVGEEINKDGLHVQSRSYWAPANIGAYSQAMAVGISEQSEENDKVNGEKENVSLVYIAGQIPLVPATMEILSEIGGDKMDVVVGGRPSARFKLSLFCKQTCLALQHLWRIGKVMEVGWWTGGIAFIVGEEDDVHEKAYAAWLAWMMVHERDFSGTEGATEEDVDVWDQRYVNVGNFAAKDRETRLPNFEAMRLDSRATLEGDGVPGFFAIQVDELPRGCEVEWQALGVKDGSVRMAVLAEKWTKIRSCYLQASKVTICFVGIFVPSPSQSLKLSIMEAIDKAKNMVQVHTGEKAQAFSEQMTIYTPYMNLMKSFDAQIVPCRAVWGPALTELTAGVVLRIEKRG